MKEIEKIIADLVSIPSQGGVDDADGVLVYLEKRLLKKKIAHKMLRRGNKNVGLVVEIKNNSKAPTYVFNAVLDTALIGNIEAWNTDPFKPVVKKGWMYGRGAADGKAGAAIFLKILEELVNKKGKNNLIFYFDADEHTGLFNGTKAFIDKYPKADGVIIGYPGCEKIVIGSRGFYRAVAKVYGTTDHSGTKRVNHDNAILKACEFIAKLKLPKVDVVKYPISPKLSVTAIHGGQLFGIIPDLVEVNVDIRTTFDFKEKQAEKLLKETAKQFDGGVKINKYESWPAYMLSKNSKIRKIMEEAVKNAGFDIKSEVSGPSNVGNLFALNGIDTIAGFGVNYKHTHEANECIDLESIPKIY
ncbi:MAG: M20/M25/M40 family metallo-hydrolase, partial [Lactobacillus sp.]|nr:M20/M25/M40 family metallo-hydrolase [Lactobacillus sp.]